MSFRRLTIEQLLKELDKYEFGEHHAHHTWRPRHKDFNGKNHQVLQRNMKNYHVNHNDWSDIAQHITLFPDGVILTGRDFGRQPASSRGHNRKNGKIPFMMEMIGNFNKGGDKFEGKQKENALKIAKYFLDKNIPVKFHRQMDRTQSCPGGAINYNKYIAEAKGQKVTPNKPSKPSRKPSTSTYKVNSIVSYLNSVGINSSFPNRKKLANQHGIRNYKGTASQNLKLLEILRSGKKSPTKPKANLVVDGYFGPATKRETQKALGVTADGIFGPNSIRALQRKVGARVDGISGYETVSKTQRYLGTPVDGKISKPSVMISELQRRLNKGNF